MFSPHCKNCNRKSRFEKGYKYDYCQNTKECKKLFLKIAHASPEYKKRTKAYFATEHGKQKRRETKPTIQTNRKR